MSKKARIAKSYYTQNSSQNKTRYYWVDNTKLFACVLVVLCHLFPSFFAAGILPSSQWASMTVAAVYTFHVPLFFVCSGFLYQKSNRVHDMKSWGGNLLSKLIGLGVPYFVFSLITLLTKLLFKNDVNTKASSDILNVLFVNPTAPYWYLYALFVFFVIVPCFNTKNDAKKFFVISLVLKALYIINADFVHMNPPYIVNSISGRLIWFALGILLAFDVIDFNKKSVRLIGAICFIAGVVLSIILFKDGFFTEYAKLIIGICFVTSFTILFNSLKIDKLNTLCQRLSALFMPVFLMHTIFAAGCRIVMVRLGIDSAFIHVAVGLFASFIFPSLYYIIAKRIPLLMFLIYPNKVIKSKENS